MSKDRDFQIDHDKTFKLAFKNKDRFKDLLNFALSSKKSNAIAGDQIEFIDTELLKKQSSGRIQEYRAEDNKELKDISLTFCKKIRDISLLKINGFFRQTATC